MEKAIAIDGPSGSGKSTVAHLISNQLGFRYIDTGAMYRACTLKVLEKGINVSDEDAVAAIVADVDIALGGTCDQPKIFLDGRDVSLEVRSAEVTANVSTVCTYGPVRSRMIELQRGYARDGGVVMDGRDIGTNVLKNAVLKVFLTADATERGHRRWLEQQEKGIDIQMTESEVIADLMRRDNEDANRTLNPLKKAEDAVELDTTGLSIEEVCKAILLMWKEKTANVI